MNSKGFSDNLDIRLTEISPGVPFVANDFSDIANVCTKICFLEVSRILLKFLKSLQYLKRKSMKRTNIYLIMNSPIGKHTCNVFKEERQTFQLSQIMRQLNIDSEYSVIANLATTVKSEK